MPDMWCMPLAILDLLPSTRGVAVKIRCWMYPTLQNYDSDYCQVRMTSKLTWWENFKPKRTYQWNSYRNFNCAFQMEQLRAKHVPSGSGASGRSVSTVQSLSMAGDLPSARGADRALPTVATILSAKIFSDSHSTNSSPSSEPGYTGHSLAAQQNQQSELHATGRCFPCIAFALKPAGCFKGNQCRHCHLCDAEQAKARRRQLQQQARRQRRRPDAT